MSLLNLFEPDHSCYTAGMLHQDLLDLLYKYRLRPDKKLGQHYLIDETVLEKIIAAAAITKDELIVEIGAGPGVLTKALGNAGAEILAVEYDRDFCHLLQEEFHNWRNVHVLCDDALRLNFGDLQKEGRPYQKIVANIPYQITNPLVRKILEPGSTIKTAVLLMQQEVAERLSAKPGTSNRGILTIMVEYYGGAEIITTVPPEAFWPAPKVNSAVLRINRKENTKLNLDPQQEKAFFWFVKQGFSGKRKTLSNSIGGGLALPKDEAVELVAAANIDPLSRAEDLTLAQWTVLFTNYSNKYYSHDGKTA